MAAKQPTRSSCCKTLEQTQETSTARTDLYIEVARQTILEDNFIAPDDETLEADILDDETSVVGDAAESLSIE
jgi:hypothetical protein